MFFFLLNSGLIRGVTSVYRPTKYIYIKGKTLRDWSLITGRGGYKTGGGGHVKFYPYEKGGRKKF